MALFEIQVQSPIENTEKELYVELANQLLFLITVMFIMYFMNCTTNSKKNMLENDFFTITLFILVGVAYHYLLIQRLITFI